jgi:hypothetical protein
MLQRIGNEVIERQSDYHNQIIGSKKFEFKFVF